MPAQTIHCISMSISISSPLSAAVETRPYTWRRRQRLHVVFSRTILSDHQWISRHIVAAVWLNGSRILPPKCDSSVPASSTKDAAVLRACFDREKTLYLDSSYMCVMRGEENQNWTALWQNRHGTSKWRRAAPSLLRVVKQAGQHETETCLQQVSEFIRSKQPNI